MIKIKNRNLTITLTACKTLLQLISSLFTVLLFNYSTRHNKSKRLLGYTWDILNLVCLNKTASNAANFVVEINHAYNRSPFEVTPSLNSKTSIKLSPLKPDESLLSKINVFTRIVIYNTSWTNLDSCQLKTYDVAEKRIR